MDNVVNDYNIKMKEIVENLTIQEKRLNFIANTYFHTIDKFKVKLLNIINYIHAKLVKRLNTVYANRMTVYIKDENPYVSYIKLYDTELQLTGLSDADFYNQFKQYVFKPSEYNFIYDFAGNYMYIPDSKFRIRQDNTKWILFLNNEQIGSFEPTTHEDALKFLQKCV